MKLRQILPIATTVCTAAVLASSIAVTASAEDATTTTSTSDAITDTRDYLQEQLVEPLIETVGRAQCTLPLLDRVGPWMCVGADADVEIPPAPEDFPGEAWEPPTATEAQQPTSPSTSAPEATETPTASADPAPSDTSTDPAPSDTSTDPAPSDTSTDQPVPTTNAPEGVGETTPSDAVTATDETTPAPNPTTSPVAARRLEGSDLALVSYQGGSGIKTTQAQACGWANYSSCWFYSDDSHASNWMHGTFGYGDKTLGKVSLDIYHSLHGAGMASTITFSTSTSIKDLLAEGDLLYGYSSTNGTAISSQHDNRSRTSLAANGYWKPWSTTYWKGYFSIDKDRYNHANVIGISWEKTGYPGYWYMYQKSIIADDENNNNVYGFNSAEDKFQTSAKGGYRLG